MASQQAATAKQLAEIGRQVRDATWMSRAACSGRAEVMELGGGWSVRTAREVCGSCPVLADCRTWVMALPPIQDPEGMVVAGLTPHQRGYERGARRLLEEIAEVGGEVRECTKCARTLSLAQFQRAGLGRSSRCRACMRRARTAAS